LEHQFVEHFLLDYKKPDSNTTKYLKNIFLLQNFTSDGEANVKTISAADPEAGAGVDEVA
jgi:hypothetical protein